MISIQQEDFDLATEYQALRADAPNIGAIVTFTGLVRDFNLIESMPENTAVQGLFLEHYPGMTEKSLAAIIETAKTRWSIINTRVVHRIGAMHPGDQIVFVGVNSAHRGDAFAACEFIMDYLKTQAPFWKKELTEEGERWVESRDTDQQAAERWQAD